MSAQPPARHAAEWVTFGLCALILGSVVSVLAVQARRERLPADPIVTVVGVSRAGSGLHHVAVALHNAGDDTAAEVQVTAELAVAGKTTAADQTVDFLAGAEDADLVFVFADDPNDGDLRVAVAGFVVP